MPSPSKTRLLISSLIVALALAAPQLTITQSGAIVKGVVTDINGAVIADSLISLSSKYGTLRTTSDSMGQFQFLSLLPGTYKLEAKKNAFQTTIIQPIHIKREGPSPPSLTLKMEVAVMGKCGDISGVSYEEKGSGPVQLAGAMQPMPPKPEPSVDWPQTPFSDATVELFKVGSDQPAVSMHPDGRGRFQFSGLALGEYTLKVSYPGYYNASSQKFQITSEDVTNVTITMIPQGEPVVCE